MSDKIPDSVYNNNFQKLLDEFHGLIKSSPKPDKIETQLKEMKEKVKTTILTGHQKDAINARCNNYLQGTYGSTSKQHLVHVHTK